LPSGPRLEFMLEETFWVNCTPGTLGRGGMDFSEPPSHFSVSETASPTRTESRSSEALKVTPSVGAELMQRTTSITRAPNPHWFRRVVSFARRFKDSSAIVSCLSVLSLPAASASLRAALSRRNMDSSNDRLFAGKSGLGRLDCLISQACQSQCRADCGSCLPPPNWPILGQRNGLPPNQSRNLTHAWMRSLGLQICLR